ncbi:DinB family protein [Adhaeribacter swui]|uniref:DinB family protein n=1 Tax=Adhaeribacter swui TaxID=2086471 RepID=A0A7G7G506_9BACT|nr:DinB family protein [Adhaeribacter swui]QNF32240.1 DinB family protein [Adhaeribacter swui]
MFADFNRTVDYWLAALEPYSLAQLCAQPSPGSWSLGQLYLHLINDTTFFIDQIKTCVVTNDHADQEASLFAQTLFRNNAFPDEVIEGSPENAFIPQPTSKEQLRHRLQDLKVAMNQAAALLQNSAFKGKTKHPGLNYFNAAEWLQFAEMHFRHHLRQKQRIDLFLQSRNWE